MFVIMSRCPHDPLMSQQDNTEEGIDCEQAMILSFQVSVR